MAAVEGPFGFAVADYEDAWVGHGGLVGVEEIGGFEELTRLKWIKRERDGRD